MDTTTNGSSRIVDASAEVLARQQAEQGYIQVWGHFAGPQCAPRWVAEHRLVVQRVLGRPLVGAEEVHHRDLDRGNNALVNLVLLPAPVHRALHEAIERRDALAVFSVEERYLRIMYGCPQPQRGVVRRRRVEDERMARFVEAWEARARLFADGTQRLSSR